jgi:dTDP-glucose 4,6-dehydratase
LIDGIYRLFQSDRSDPVNIGNPGEFTVRQLAERIIELTRSTSEIVMHPLPEDDPKVRKPDITRARERLGWEPCVQLEEGLRRTIEFFRAHPAT